MGKSSKSSEAEVRPARVRPQTYIIGLIYALFIVTLVNFFSGFSDFGQASIFGTNVYHKTDWNIIVFMYFWPFIILLMTTPLVKSRRLTKQEVAVIISMVWVTWSMGMIQGDIRGNVMWPVGMTLQPKPYYPDRFLKDTERTWPFWMPDPKDPTWASGFLSGGSSVPWAKWAFPMIYQSAWVGSLFIVQLFVATLLRRQWLDVEELPFPMATGAAHLINQSTEPAAGKSIFKSIYLWIGIVAGFLGQMPLLLPYLSTA